MSINNKTIITSSDLLKKLTKSLKKQLIKLKAMKTATNKFERVPETHSHQEELDENALNEALEARLMEAIATAPVTSAHVTLTIKAVVPADLETLDTAVLARVATRFQTAEAQC